MKKLLFLLFTLTFLFSQAEITNIQASQRTDGSQIVDITYDLAPDPVFEFFEISVLVSIDGGQNYTNMSNVSGDLGDIIEPGNGKTLTWNFGEQFGGTYSDQIKIKIIGDSYALVDNNNNQELPFEMVTVSSGEYTFGQNDEIRTIDYDYEIMKYEVTDMDYILFALDKIADMTDGLNQDCYDCLSNGQFYCYSGNNCINANWVNDGFGDCNNDEDENFDGNWDGLCGGDAFGIIVNTNEIAGYYPGDSNYPAGNYTYIEFSQSKISWNGEIFEVEEGNVNHPVTGVTWFGAWAFATHYGMEIPDQYEWEKAARGNTGYDYPWGDQLSIENANFNDTPVGFYGMGSNTATIGSFNGSTYNCENNLSDGIFITEITDPQNSSEAGRFVELYNGNDNDINLDGYAIQRWSNANSDPSTPIELNGTIEANDFFIICNSSDKFESTYTNVTCDMDIGAGGPADSNGDDTIALIWGGVILDIFGIPGEDGSGTAAEFEDGRAERAPWTIGASNIWIESDWLIDNDSGGGYGPQYAPEDFDPGFWIGYGIDISNNNICDDLVTIDSPTTYGAYDMAGNVWEIVKNDDDNYFIRGGGYNNQPIQLQSWHQESYNGSNGNTGFRCMRIINQAQSRNVPKEKFKEYYLNKKNNTQKSNLKK
ncbi:SUMF1/EgtB/PvdO family nonheme iron enzyme [Candidatus Marinimicrobia bacterium]|nr:SUMF1/EgtB/PvdO family nonheme iron enzyme [Candidatus Neomarinimicrobiota bacterium]